MPLSKIALGVKALLALLRLRGNYKQSREEGNPVPDAVVDAVKQTAKEELLAEAKRRITKQAGDRG